MINTIIAYDDSDLSLGEYFNKSYLYIKGLEKHSKISITEFNGNNCLESTITNSLQTLNHNNFVFVGISHGSDDALSLVGADKYISPNNANECSNSFFYSTACYIGKELGPSLIGNGSKCFIGYIDESFAPVSEEFVDLFIECELHAIKNFYLTSKTIEVLYKEMIQFTDEKIIELASGTDIIEAMALIDNRDRIVLLGDNTNKQLSRHDFGFID